MNKTELRHQMKVAEEQARISELKMHSKINDGEEYSAMVYGVRMTALRMYATHLKDELKKHERKTFKRVNK